MAEARLQARRFYVRGTVQGVGYRFFAERVAARIGVAGYVKNLPDGRVEVYAIGDPDQLEALREELARGPRAARVTGVEAEEAAVVPRYGDGFTVEFEPW